MRDITPVQREALMALKDGPIPVATFNASHCGPDILALIPMLIEFGGKATSDGQTLTSEEPDPTTRVVHVDLAAGQEITVNVPWRLDVPRTGRDRVGRFSDGVRLGSF